jgi:hypothetical protein
MTLMTMITTRMNLIIARRSAISTRTRLISTRGKYDFHPQSVILPAKCDLHTTESKFYTYACEYTLKSVIFTRRV